MKNLVTFFNRKQENNSLDAFSAFALNNRMMNLVCGGDDPVMPGYDPILTGWQDPEKK